jgi:TetR/AcrR family transcriptional regulator, transcriptional repressor for nem operon
MARPRSFDESAVVRAAREIFWTKGYTATSLDDLMAATGLGKGSLYNTFGGKEELFHRALDDYCSVSDAGLRANLGCSGSGLARVENYLRSGIDGGDGRGCMLAKSVAELARSDAVVAERARGTLGLLEELLTVCLEDARLAGELREDADPRALAGMVLAVGRGMEALAKAGSPPEDLRRIADATLASLPRTTSGTQTTLRGPS